MKEKTIAIIITIILLVIGLLLGMISPIFSFDKLKTNSNNKFNFYKSKLDINGREISETLYFHTDKNYHTLFRNFDSPLTINNETKNSVRINSVKCSAGTAYFRINDKCYYKDDFLKPDECVSYTEDNEYGCTFGDTYGFSNNNEYSISTKFTINPENLFLINDKHYIKYIAYSRNNHHDLLTEESIILSGNNIHESEYKSSEYVIIYIPYEGGISGYNIIEQNDFVFDGEKSESNNGYLYKIFILIIHLLPGIIFFFSWYYFGKELSEPDVPEQLSQIPNKRKPWEVAIYFNPPFGVTDPNFFSTLLLDFYRRKIIDIKLEEGIFKKDLLIKLNIKSHESMDPIEKKFYQILEKLKGICKDKYIKNDYFNLNKAVRTPLSSFSISSMYSDLRNLVNDKGKMFIEKKGVGIFILLMILVGGLSILSGSLTLLFFSIFSLIIISIITSLSSLLIRYKKDFYKEYIMWQSFKKWLSYSPSMKEHGHRGIVFWEEFLVYATALGVSKKVLKELRHEGIISEKQFATYINIHSATLSFATSGSSGGFSGAGGGGVGGGGGGGR